MSEISGGGDKLARGARTATFSGGFGPGELKPSLAPESEPRNEDIPSVIDNSALFAPKVPSVFYKGRPLNKRILVIRVELESNTTIIIPDTAKAKSEVGRIVAFSSDSDLSNQGLTEGSLVLFDKFAAYGQEFPLLGKDGKVVEHLMLQEVDIQMGLEECHPNSDNSPSVQ